MILIDPVAARLGYRIPEIGLGGSTVILDAREADEMPTEITTVSCKVEDILKLILHLTLLADRQISDDDCENPTLEREVGLKLVKKLPCIVTLIAPVAGRSRTLIDEGGIAVYVIIPSIVTADGADVVVIGRLLPIPRATLIRMMVLDHQLIEVETVLPS